MKFIYKHRGMPQLTLTVEAEHELQANVYVMGITQRPDQWTLQKECVEPYGVGGPRR